MARLLNLTDQILRHMVELLNLADQLLILADQLLNLADQLLNFARNRGHNVDIPDNLTRRTVVRVVVVVFIIRIILSPDLIVSQIVILCGKKS
jgi:hypothetical protein